MPPQMSNLFPASLCCFCSVCFLCTSVISGFCVSSDRTNYCWSGIIICTKLVTFNNPSSNSLFGFDVYTSSLHNCSQYLSIFHTFVSGLEKMPGRLRLPLATVEQIERERDHVLQRISDILVRVADPERDYSDDELTALMNRLEGYFVRLFKLPVSRDGDTVDMQEQLCLQYESLLISDLEEVKKPVKVISGFLRRHRHRVRRQQAGNH
jgi:hypothetical protein